MIGRYSDSTIDALEMMDDDDKINLELIVALIRHIVRNEDVSPSRLGAFVCTRVSVCDLAEAGTDGGPRKAKHVGMK